jgi:hypothetical protein
MALSVADIDAAIDALALGVESYTTPSGLTVKRTSLDNLMKLRALRKSQEDDAEGGIVPQYAEFQG